MPGGAGLEQQTLGRDPTLVFGDPGGDAISAMTVMAGLASARLLS